MQQEKNMNEKDFEVQNIFGKGEANTAYAQYFTGNSFLNPVKTGGGDCPLMIANVTFEPGCRNNWHVHHASKGGGQPPGVKHWHGAKGDSWFSHLAFELPGENTSTEWLEPVSDEAYSKIK